MEKTSKEFQIRDLLKITKNNRYATTVAAFEIVENFDKLDIDFKKIGGKRNKIAVTSMMLLAENIIKYDFITDEQRKKLKQELENEKSPYLKKLEQEFTEKKKLIAKDPEEDLEEEDIGEIEVVTFKDEDESDNFDNSEDISDSDDSDDSDLDDED